MPLVRLGYPEKEFLGLWMYGVNKRLKKRTVKQLLENLGLATGFDGSRLHAFSHWKKNIKTYAISTIA